MRVFYDGFLTEPRLDHPEGVAVHPDGSVWCGGEAGQLYRIEPDGSAATIVAATDGFLLGVAIPPAGDAVFACDVAHRAVFRYDLATGELTKFATGAGGVAFRNPNAIAFSRDGSALYVTDSYPPEEPGPSVFRFGLDGAGEIWYGEPSAFANGVALAPDGSALYVAESFLPGVRRIAIDPVTGAAGERELVAELPGTVPDGLAFGPDGLLYVGCYEPSQVLSIDSDGSVRVVAHDPTAHVLCHPTNLAFRPDGSLVTANLGRWHLTAVKP
ncbi:MAG TPA: SMP-30/gluconolactonase/LRE family protein [Natronosporangium sp.]